MDLLASFNPVLPLRVPGPSEKILSISLTSLPLASALLETQGEPTFSINPNEHFVVSEKKMLSLKHLYKKATF